MEYIRARNVLFSEVFKSKELVHFKSNGDFSIPDDGILIIKDLGNDTLNKIEKKLIDEHDRSPFLILTGVRDTEKDAQVSYSGKILFLDYKPTKQEIIIELI